MSISDEMWDSAGHIADDEEDNGGMTSSIPRVMII